MVCGWKCVGEGEGVCGVWVCVFVCVIACMWVYVWFVVGCVWMGELVCVGLRVHCLFGVWVGGCVCGCVCVIMCGYVCEWMCKCGCV